MEEKNLQLERLVFFSDAVVAIAITLLALDIRIEPTASVHITFADIFNHWKTFAAFTLSFVNIANCWKTHHSFFVHINRIDEKLLWYNILWLFFIILLPFSTSLVSSYFFDTTAIFVYSLNTFFIAVFQNNIWDYASFERKFLKDQGITDDFIGQIRIYCNLDMINGIVAIALSFLSPVLAFVLLFTKLPMLILARLFYAKKWIRMRHKRP